VCCDGGGGGGRGVMEVEQVEVELVVEGGEVEG